MSDKQQGSTAQYWTETAAGTVREGIAKVTGNPHDQAAADEHKRAAQDHWDASHAKAKIGSTTITPASMAVDNDDRREGAWKETIGSAKESVGTVLGSEQLQKEGRDQSQEGQAQSTVGQTMDWISGATDRLRGSINTAAAQLFGDKEDAERNQAIHDQGKAQQRGAE